MSERQETIIDPGAKNLPKMLDWLTLGEAGGTRTAAKQFLFAADLIKRGRRLYKHNDCRVDRDHWKLARSYIVDGLMLVRRAVGAKLFDELVKEAITKHKNAGW